MCLLLTGIIRAQVDTVKLLPVIVTSFQDESATQTSIQIQPITLKQISQSGAFNLSDALAKIPVLVSCQPHCHLETCNTRIIWQQGFSIGFRIAF